nr:DUF4932 domain-containing protein [uncultured Arsenicibacter sp.]
MTTALCCLFFSVKAQPGQIIVEADPGVELVNALVVQNSPEFIKDSLADPYLYRTTRLMRISYEYFASFRSHPAVKKTQWMTDKIGTGVYLLPLFYEGFPRPRRHTPVSSEILQAIHPDPDSARQFVEDYIHTLAGFYQNADFAAFQHRYQSVYELAVSQVKQNLPPANFIPVMEAYYGTRKSAYRIIVNPFFKAEWGMAWQVLSRRGPIANQIASPMGEQLITGNRITDTGYNNAAAIRNLSVHEFGHTFVNTLTVLPVFATALAVHKSLFKPIAGQAQYTDWETSFNEHLVRAGEVRIALALGLPRVAAQLREQNEAWMYLSFFEKQLSVYEANRKRYPTLKSYMGQLIDSLSALH